MASIKKYSTSKGDRWEVRWRPGGRGTKEIKKWASSFAGAKALKSQAESDAVNGIVYDPRLGTRLLNDYYDEWVATRLVEGRPLTYNTKRGYNGLWDRNVRDTLGRKQLRGVDPASVRAWYGTVAAAKTQDQAAKSYRLLHAVFETAAEVDGLIRSGNPCRLKGAGREHAAERPMVEAAFVLELAGAIRERYWALVLVAAFASLRTGELLGLRRRDVDILHKTVTVAGQAHERKGAGRVWVANAKTAAGLRTIGLPKFVVDALDHHLKTYTGVDVDAPVFTAPAGGPVFRSTLSREWASACTTAGAPAGFRVYDLRHHGLTLSARKPGVTTKELMARAGHASPVAALKYQHATQERDREVAAFMQRQITKAEKKREKRAPVVSIGE